MNKKKNTILVVDSDTQTQEMLGVVLDEADFKLVNCLTGKQATHLSRSSMIRKKLVRILALSVIFVLCSCAHPRESELQTASQKKIDEKRFNALLELSDLNERAFEYHQYCLSKTEPMNEVFLKNFKIVSNLLFDEGLKVVVSKPEYIVRQILTRRKRIQNMLSKHYRTKGCQSEEAETAREHYEIFGKLSEEQVKMFF